MADQILAVLMGIALPIYCVWRYNASIAAQRLTTPDVIDYIAHNRHEELNQVVDSLFKQATSFSFFLDLLFTLFGNGTSIKRTQEESRAYLKSELSPMCKLTNEESDSLIKIFISLSLVNARRFPILYGLFCILILMFYVAAPAKLQDRLLNNLLANYSS